jgi:hypothetical protein
MSGTTALCEPWPSSGFLNNLIFMVWGCQPHTQPPTWKTRVSLFAWLLPLNLSGLGGPTSSYATAGIALRVSGVLKPHHHDKMGIASVGKSITMASKNHKLQLQASLMTEETTYFNLFQKQKIQTLSKWVVVIIIITIINNQECVWMWKKWCWQQLHPIHLLVTALGRRKLAQLNTGSGALT